jgi:thioesterase superfamily protein 4
VSGDGLPRVDADYWYSAVERKVHGVVTFGSGAEGMPGFVHGGAISGIFDEGVGLLSWYLGTPVATRELTIRYRQFIPINSTVELLGHLQPSDGLMVSGRAELRGRDGTLHATMTASFVELDPVLVEQMAQTNASRHLSTETP